MRGAAGLVIALTVLVIGVVFLCNRPKVDCNSQPTWENYDLWLKECR